MSERLGPDKTGQDWPESPVESARRHGFTSGPWSEPGTHGTDRFEVQGEHRRVAVVDTLADARLIAAAPELLEAARALLFQVDGVHQMACAYGPGENSEDFEQVRDTPDPGCPDCRAMQLAERAIRKAEGRE